MGNHFFPQRPENISNKKVVIIGLDGVPYSLLQHYIDLKVMDHLKEIVSSGNLLPMKSTLPEVSSVAWTSFMTGKNPAEHGIFGFMEIDRNTYEYTFPNFLSLGAPPFWEVLGVPTVAFNIPQTYPARPTNGIIVSGFVALDLQKAIYPPRIYDYLRSIDYRLDVQSRLALTDPESFFKDLFYTFNRRTEALRHFYKNEHWQVFIGTITETDRLHHFFFDSAKGGEYYNVFAEFYRMLDDFLWEMFSWAQKDNALFLTCSDHGFTPIKSEVYANRYLIEQGILSFSGEDDFKNITSNSLAFCLDPARIYIHLKDSYARGKVDTCDYDSLRNEIKDRFENLYYEGKKIVKRVYFKEDIFFGECFDRAPDLYVLAEPGFDMKSSIKKDLVFGRSHFKGAHTYDDAHLFISGTIPPDTTSVFTIEEIVNIVSKYLSN